MNANMKSNLLNTLLILAIVILIIIGWWRFYKQPVPSVAPVPAAQAQVEAAPVQEQLVVTNAKVAFVEQVPVSEQDLVLAQFNLSSTSLVSIATRAKLKDPVERKTNAK